MARAPHKFCVFSMHSKDDLDRQHSAAQEMYREKMDEQQSFTVCRAIGAKVKSG